ncbi:MAG TPA: peptidoglycan-associated lipoprotein Pal [Methylomirabilota bacterium]|jgi:peptidoglycan-associated lipoprotein
MKMAFTAIGAMALLALVSTGCARMMAQSEDGSTPGSGGMSGSSGSGGSGGGWGGTSRAGRSGGGMAERPPVKDFRPATEMIDVHFDFDRYDIRSQEESALQSNAAWLRSNKNYLVLIEGHSDERGTSEYNVALGERRAKSAQNYLVSHGIDSRRIAIISYGEHRQQCNDSTEDCWSRNRRAHFRVKRQ